MMRGLCSSTASKKRIIWVTLVIVLTLNFCASLLYNSILKKRIREGEATYDHDCKQNIRKVSIVASPTRAITNKTIVLGIRQEKKQVEVHDEKENKVKEIKNKEPKEQEIKKEEYEEKRIIKEELKENPNKETIMKDKPVRSGFFEARYNSKIPTLWNVNHYALPKDVAKWWFAYYRKPFENNTVILNTLKLFHKAGAPIIELDPKKKMFKTCAVVGNSDSLTGSGFGEKIDSSDAVFRFNYAITDKYETDVGRKCTHRFLYPESTSGTMDYTKETLLLTPFKMIDLRWVIQATTNLTVLAQPFGRKRIKSTPEKVWVINPRFMNYVQGSWVNNSRKFPSLGMVGVIFSLHYCDDINVFGYGANAKGEWAHYFGKTHILANRTRHDPNNEMAVITKLHDQHKLKFHSPLVRPWW